MPGHRGFEAAPQRRAVNRNDHRLGGIFHGPQAVHQSFTHLLGRGLSEFADVGAGNERPSGADQHDGLDVGIVVGALEGSVNPLGHSGAERVHGRVLDGDDGNVPLAGEADEFRHSCIRLL